MASALRAPVFEIFSGIQGEGVLVGVRQVFVRFCGCNRHCRYCDTRQACLEAPTCAVERAAGTRQFAPLDNPLSVEQVIGAVGSLDPPPGFHHSVTLTGGEPLLHPEFLAALCPALQECCLPIYLETNGTLPEALARIAGQIDYVAMDIKLESATGEPADWDAHRRFLELAAGKDTHVKAVVAAGTTTDELRRLGELVARVGGGTAVVLQPVTPAGGLVPPSPMQVLRMQEELRRLLPDVRVIPQVHKLMGQK